MPRKRRGADEIIGLLRQAEIELGAGLALGAVCQKLGISEQTYYRWRSRMVGFVRMR